MNMTPVTSSTIAAIGYDEANQVLRVEFIHGGVYEYFDVPRAEYDSFIGAASHGQYLASQIKGRYRYARV